MSDPRIGTRIGGYEIESLLGRGGMGVVYKARHLRLGRMVALKILAPELAADENFRTRFVRESQMAASIDHPNVIPVYDADEIEGELFLAMRYVDGTDLKQVIEQDGALEPDKALLVISQIGGALDAAHANGLIHRDIKPGNVLVGLADTGSEHVYLTDFGLTKHSSSHSGLTATGAFVGTIDYIAPEQIEGKSVDARTDIYALGCVLYELLTGRVPFQKDADVAVMYAHLMDPRPKVTEANPALPGAVDAVLDKAMARDPDDRYASAGAMVADLRAALGQTSSPVAVPTPPRQQAPAPSIEPPVHVATPVSSQPPGKDGRRLSGKVMAIGAAALVVAAAIAYFATRPDGEVTDDPAAPGLDTSGAIFVSPDGSEGADGTSDDPFASLADAVKEAGEGGTVILADGLYESDKVPMVTIKDPVTIMGAEGARPVLRGNDRFADAIRIAAGTSDVTLANITFDNFNGEGVKVFCVDCGKVPENQNIVFEGLEFTSGGTPITVENVAGMTLQGINVHENDFTGFVCSPGPCDQVSIADSSFTSSRHKFGEGVRIERGDGLVIETSDMSGNPGNGLYSNASSTSVSRSRFQDNGDSGAWLAASNSEIRDSILARNGEVGLVLGEVFCDACRAAGTFSVVNVLSAQNDVGIDVEAHSKVTLQMFNSIVADNVGTGLRISGSVKLARLDHDLFDVGGAIAVLYRGESYSEEDLGNGEIPAPNNSETYGGPLEFIAPDDFHLVPGSEGVNAGTQEGVVSLVDIDGNPRVAGEEIDIGPHEQE
ncbi:MAG TPA: protein kinase [Actinomycetota bacterium]|nr:protein kinase [Actinomycetota bacterium]